MANVIAAIVAELVEHDREAQHDTIFVRVLRHFLIAGTDQISLAFVGCSWYLWVVTNCTRECGKTTLMAVEKDERDNYQRR